MTHFINIGLLFSFLTLAGSGVYAFVQPFSIDVTRIHIVFGTLTLVLIALHLYKKISYFKKQVQIRPMPFLLCALLCGGFVYLSIQNAYPVRQLIAQSYEAKHRHEIIRPAPVVATMQDKKSWVSSRRAEEGDDTLLSVHVSLQEDHEIKPGVAIWAETNAGTLIETLYISEDLAYSDKPIWNGQETPRHKILPIWRHRYTTVTGIDPEGKVDAASGATENHSFTLEGHLSTAGDDYLIFIEINAPNDPNETWDDPHVGQPSILYSAYVEHQRDQKYVLLELTGHGGKADKSGVIHYDLESITSAKNLVDLVLAYSRSSDQ